VNHFVCSTLHVTTALSISLKLISFTRTQVHRQCTCAYYRLCPLASVRVMFTKGLCMTHTCPNGPLKRDVRVSPGRVNVSGKHIFILLTESFHKPATRTSHTGWSLVSQLYDHIRSHFPRASSREKNNHPKGQLCTPNLVWQKDPPATKGQ